MLLIPDAMLHRNVRLLLPFVPFVLLLLPLPACHTAEVSLLPLTDPDLAYFFLVPLDANGFATRVSPVYGVNDRKVIFGGTPVLKLEARERSSVAVGLKRAQLAALHPGFDPSRETEISVALGSPPARPAVRFAGASVVADSGIPSDPALYAEGRALEGSELAELRGRLRITVVLSVPIDPEHCRGRSNELSPFGTSVMLLPPSRAIPGEPQEEPLKISRWRRAQRLLRADADRLILFTGAMIYVVRRDEGIELPRSVEGYDPGHPSAAIPLGLLGTPIAWGRDIAIDRFHTDANGERTVLVGGVSTSRAIATIWELKLSAAGIRFVSTATIAGPELDGVFINGIAIDASGTALAVANPSLLLIRPAFASIFTIAPEAIAGEAGVEFQHAISTGLSARPFLLSENRGRLLLGNAATHDWLIFRRLDRVSQVRYQSLAASADGRELWAGGLRSGLRRVGNGDWTLIEAELPPRYRCANVSGARILFENIDSVSAVAIGPEAAYVVSEGCSAALRLRRSDLCTSMITSSPLPAGSPPVELTSAAYGDGGLVVAGSYGTVLAIEE